ncbi:MAG: hypothetical protein R2719_14925 [Micropruina sp.]
MKVILDDDGRPLAVDVVIDAYLNGLGRTGLRALVLDLAATSAEARRVLRLRASPAGSDVQRELIGHIDHALSQIDLNFYDPYEYDYYGELSDEERFGELFDVLDEIERHLDAGRAEQMLPILDRALTGLRQVGEDAEEADGLIDGAVGRVVTLYARACRAGHPEPVVLARWLVAFRADQPHWLDLSLDEFAEAFDEPAWLAYREAVSALDAAWTPDAGFDEVTAMGPNSLTVTATSTGPSSCCSATAGPRSLPSSNASGLPTAPMTRWHGWIAVCARAWSTLGRTVPSTVSPRPRSPTCTSPPTGQTTPLRC